VATDRVREVRIAGSRGKSLFGWLVSPPDTFQSPRPAVLVMHGWGANAAMMWQVVPPLHDAGLAVLLIDARCHGRSDDEEFTSMPRLAEDIAAGLAWLRQQAGIAPDRLALVGHSVGAAARVCSRRRPGGSEPGRVRAPARGDACLHGREAVDATRLVERSARAGLLLVDGDQDLREAVAPPVAVG
jgi:pimeloyl-ACP methyl ester carboxylesterase